VSTHPQWHFVGNVPENYERYLVPSIFAPWAQDLIEAAALRPGERVLDIACGTGIVARTAARALGGSSVVGLDLSAPMLAAARSAAKAEGVSIEWREGSAVPWFLGELADGLGRAGQIDEDWTQSTRRWGDPSAMKNAGALPSCCASKASFFGRREDPKPR
jgi:SAM-dependent methyltransferase